jgi:hypothetical protein
MIPIVFALLLIQDKAVVEGTVLNALTNEPLKKARVVLDEGSNQYAVTSSSEGKFQFWKHPVRVSSTRTTSPRGSNSPRATT